MFSLEKQAGADIVVHWVKLLQVALPSTIELTDSSPGCSVSDPASSCCSREAGGR